MQLPISIETLAFKEAGSSYHIRSHQWNTDQWFCVVYGKVRMKIEGKRFLLKPNTSIAIPAGKIRSPRSKGKAVGYLLAEFTSREIDVESFGMRVLSIPAEARPDLYALVEEMKRGPDRLTPAYSASLLMRILVSLQRGAGAGTLPGPGQNGGLQEDLIQNVDTFIRNNLHRKISRNDIAKALAISVPHLSRLYRRGSGKTLVQTLTEIRIEKAKRLLLESTLSVSQVALEVGYRSFSHFTKTFQQATGVPPSDFRHAKGHVYRRI